ncbi:MAG: magnesium transporter [Candidatus Omnitrophota bacterium]
MQGSRDSMLGLLIQPEIHELLEQKNYKELREILTELDPADIADFMVVLSPEECAVVFRLLPQTISADVFEHLPFSDQEELIQYLGQEQVAAILNEMEPDDRTALLEELPGKVTRRLMGLLSPEERRISQTLLGYPEESVGRLMTPEYVAIKKDWSVEEAFQHIRKTGQDKETVNVIYVTDEDEKLIDDIRLRSLLFADPQTKISELMDYQYTALAAQDDQETAIEMMTKYDRIALPVVDSQGALVGIVTSDDVFDVAEEETTEDIHRLAGMEALDEPFSQVSILTMIRKRAGWLAILFAGETLTITAMEGFSEEILKWGALTFFIPLIISMGGNSGSQATSLVIRAMALQEVKLKDWYRTLGREFLTGILLGVILGAISIARVHLFPVEGVIGERIMLTSLTVSLAVICVVLFGSLIGSMLPFILRSLGFDPALSSAPLVATLVDVMGVVIYFSIAKLIFPI